MPRSVIAGGDLRAVAGTKEHQGPLQGQFRPHIRVVDQIGCRAQDIGGLDEFVPHCQCLRELDHDPQPVAGIRWFGQCPPQTGCRDLGCAAAQGTSGRRAQLFDDSRIAFRCGRQQMRHEVFWRYAGAPEQDGSAFVFDAAAQIGAVGVDHRAHQRVS